jgi:hypothetical protein
MTTQSIAATEAFLPTTSTVTASKKGLWTGRVLSGTIAAFFLMDAVMALAKPPFVVQATVQLGYPASTIVGMGAVLLVCTIFYLIPRTAALGAALLTGYLGGAVATNVRVSAGWFDILVPFIFGCALWGSLYLRDRRLKLLFAK